MLPFFNAVELLIGKKEIFTRMSVILFYLVWEQIERQYGNIWIRVSLI